MPPKTPSSGRRRLKLVEPNVHARVRPMAESGGHADNGRFVYKKLKGWENDSIQLEDGHGITNYPFPKTVHPPDVTQEHVYETVAADMVDKFVQFGGYDALLFAYGQTGTGKTHTILGPERAWGSTSHPDWGLFPRVVDAVFKEMEGRGGSTKFVLQASAVEFYMCECFDLLDSRAPCLIEKQSHRPLGAKHITIEKVADMVPFLDSIGRYRTTRSTRMNTGKEDHSGSSRSHCAMILTLHQVDVASGKLCTTRFNCVDLAGAERPRSNGEEHVSAMDAIMQYWRGKVVSTGGQGVIINYELSCLRTQVVQATDLHKRGKKNGWETWFACQYGTDLAALRAPTKPQKPAPLVDAVELAEKGAAAASVQIAPKSSNSFSTGQTWPHSALRAPTKPQKPAPLVDAVELAEKGAAAASVQIAPKSSNSFSTGQTWPHSALRAPTKPQKPAPLVDAVELAEKAALAGEAAFKRTPESGHPSSKFHNSRKVMARHSRREFEALEKLQSTMA